MITGQNIIEGKISKNDRNSIFQALNANTQKPIAPNFEEASKDQIQNAIVSASKAFPVFAHSTPQKRADLLTKIKEELLISENEIKARYREESGYSEGRANIEFQRTIGQIQSFIDLLNEGSYLQARIHKTGAGPDLRKMLYPIGPIVVFGASNFPLAFSTAGGDTISALAAGCPVILKAHPYHAGTSEWVASCIVRAISNSGLPHGIFSHLNGESHQVGEELVNHPNIKGVGFTGSFKGGKALYDLAQKRTEPIPVFAEMGSVNPIFIFSNRLKTDSELPVQLAASVALGWGQFCTNPGLIVICSDESEPSFFFKLKDALLGKPSGTMVHPNIEQNYLQKVEQLSKEKIYLEKSKESNAAVGLVKADQFLQNPEIGEEVFGPFTLVVHCLNQSEMLAVLEELPGQLTLSLLGTDSDKKALQQTLPLAKQKAGRLLFEGVPTGVAVTQAMQHGGPFPASTDGRFTSVGTDAIYRWIRPVAFQDCPNELLPPALQKENPLKLWRSINGELMQD